MVMEITLDRNSARGLSRQIADQIREKIRSGELSIEQRLPSTRILSKNLQVNRITVTQAYRQLRAEGILRSGVGSGTYVDSGGTGSSSPSPIPILAMDRSNYRSLYSKGTEAILRRQQEIPLPGGSEE